MKRRGLTQFSRLYLFWTLRITFFFPPVGRWLARPSPARPGPARLGSARSYTRNPPVFPLARVISRFNGLASVPGVGINFNRSYLDRANIEKFMRTGLCLFLYLSLSLPLSRSLSSRDRLENSSPREHTMHTTRINSKKYSERNSRGGIILEEAIRVLERRKVWRRWKVGRCFRWIRFEIIFDNFVRFNSDSKRFFEWIRTKLVSNLLVSNFLTLDAGLEDARLLAASSSMK